MRKIHKSHLIAVIDKTPALCAWGLAFTVWGPVGGYLRGHGRINIKDFERGREDLKEQLRGFQLCCRWLALYRRRKTVNFSIGTSWKLKHVVEAWAGEYVSNGAFIAAVIHLGIVYRPDFPNIHLGISGELVEEAEVTACGNGSSRQNPYRKETKRNESVDAFGARIFS